MHTAQTPPTLPSDLITLREAAKVLTVDLRTVQRWARKGVFPVVRVGPFRRQRVSRAVVLTHVQR